MAGVRGSPQCSCLWGIMIPGVEYPADIQVVSSVSAGTYTSLYSDNTVLLTSSSLSVLLHDHTLTLLYVSLAGISDQTLLLADSNCGGCCLFTMIFKPTGV